MDNHLSLPRFSSRVVTLPSPSCAEHCLSAHAWRCIRVCLCFRWVCVCALPTSQDKGRGRQGETGSIAHTPPCWQRKNGRRADRQKEKEEKEGEEEGERLHPSVPGRQPSAQIGPMGTHSLYTCSNQLAAATCLSGRFTLRHAPLPLVWRGGGGVYPTEKVSTVSCERRENSLIVHIR